MGIVAGLDSSSGFTRIVVCDADTGAVLRQGCAPHPVEPKATDIDPQAWLLSLGEAATGGLLEGVQAIGVSAQQHGLITLDAQGAPVRPALLGNDKRAQAAAADLIDALGGRQAWAEAVGSVPQSGQPVAKLRWLARAEPDAARRVAAVMQPHDWLVWQLLGRPARRTTDRGGASGTGLLVGRHGGLPHRSGRAGARAAVRAARGARPRGSRGHHPGRAADLGGHRRDDGGGLRARGGRRRRRGVAGGVRFRDGRAPRGAARPDRDDHLVRRRDRDAPAGRAHPQRRTGAARQRRTARRHRPLRAL
ncbi:xylulose kinase, partial [Streptomyces pristinaespiralis ATCC 25486]